VSSIPRSWRSFLLKKWWFRECIFAAERSAESTGTERKLDFEYGPPLIEPDQIKERAIRELDSITTVGQAHLWRGRLCAPPRRTVHALALKKADKIKYKKYVLRTGPSTPVRLWMSQTLRLVEHYMPHWLQWCPTPHSTQDQLGLKKLKVWKAYSKPTLWRPALEDVVPEWSPLGLHYRLN